ncbi:MULTISPECIES: EF-hand domain-containing protein [Derxia]|uniref:EF-hand domain-containing protein n=1 Tax=Derxia gummosa DSM 723 TaxID=1121388 RepID=A0A8B6XD79_9BURK|nr:MULTISPECIES: EF-hand domain-containing protein [Derxia]
MNLQALATACAVALLLALPAHAADDAPATGNGTAPRANADRAERLLTELDKRFNTADTDHDGSLTQAEAKAMPRVAQNFGAIDRDGSGTVTRAELMSYLRDRQADRQR